MAPSFLTNGSFGEIDREIEKWIQGLLRAVLTNGAPDVWRMVNGSTEPTSTKWASSLTDHLGEMKHVKVGPERTLDKFNRGQQVRQTSFRTIESVFKS